MSFRIYNNIPKTIITPQIKTLSIPINIPDSVTPVAIGASVPQNIYILAFKVTLTKNDSPTSKKFRIYFTNPDDSTDKFDYSCFIPERLLGFNDQFIRPINKTTSLSLLNINSTGVESQKAVIEFSYYEL